MRLDYVCILTKIYYGNDIDILYIDKNNIN